MYTEDGLLVSALSSDPRWLSYYLVSDDRVFTLMSGVLDISREGSVIKVTTSWSVSLQPRKPRPDDTNPHRRRGSVNGSETVTFLGTKSSVRVTESGCVILIDIPDTHTSMLIPPLGSIEACRQLLRGLKNRNPGVRFGDPRHLFDLIAEANATRTP